MTVSNYIDQASKFIDFLGSTEHSTDEVLANLVLNVFKPIEATAIYLFELTPDGDVESIARWGASELTRNIYPDKYDLIENTPITECIRSRKIVWITTLPIWPKHYSRLSVIPYTDPEKSFVCFPIDKLGTPVAAIGIACMPELSPSTELNAFLRTIARVFSLHLYSSEKNTFNTFGQSKQSVSPEPPTLIKLSDRQEMILKLISEGQSNYHISELLGYSESTIRQETIRIYSLLECDGRVEASNIYREKLAKLT